MTTSYINQISCKMRKGFLGWKESHDTWRNKDKLTDKFYETSMLLVLKTVYIEVKNCFFLE